MNTQGKLPSLPAELLSQVFLEVDPHTLYTSIRCLSREWRRQVEENLLKAEFLTNRWKVGLRVTRKPKNGKAWRGGIAGQEGGLAPGAAWQRIQNELEAMSLSEEEIGEERQRARDAFTQSILSRQGAMEDELPISLQGEASSTLIHVLPLEYNGYDAETAMLQFGTAETDWYAMFESEVEEGDNSSRLDLDFSIVWRFPGDGQSGSEGDGWGVPDQENGWLSRFYCSNFDTKNTTVAQEEGVKVLHTTPLARRTRRRTVTLQPEFHHPELSPSSSTLDWSDEGHEYMSLRLSLGTEFFVRRSSQANFLMRRLETEAEAGEDRRRRGRQGGSSSGVSSLAPTPRRDAISNSSSGPRISVADSKARLQSRSIVTASSSGMSTPNRSSSGNEKTGASTSYASVVSTPASGCSSPRGLTLPMRLKGLPRIAKLQRELNLDSGHRAPFPSASTSGYSSVKHQARLQNKDEEGYATSTASESLPSSPRHNLATSSSSHGSIPRACFSAHLLVSPSTSPLRWNETQAGSSSRNAISSSSSPLTLWEWSR